MDPIQTNILKKCQTKVNEICELIRCCYQNNPIELLRDREIKEIRETLGIVETKISFFLNIGVLPCDFIYLIEKMFSHLVSYKLIFAEMANLRMPLKVWPEMKKILLFKGDYLLKQQLDQLEFEFIRRLSDFRERGCYIPIDNLTDIAARVFWANEFGADVKKKKIFFILLIIKKKGQIGSL